MTVISGQSATISSTRAHILNGEAVLLGTTCEATASVRGLDVDLKVKSTFSEVDTSQERGYAERLVADITASVPDGGGLIVLNPTTSELRSGTNLVLLVKSGIVSKESVPTSNATAPSATNRSVFLDCRILEVSEAGIGRLNLGSPELSLTGAQRAWIYDEGQRSELLLALSQEPEVRIIARPRAVVALGNTGTFSVTMTTNINGNSVTLGPACEVTPRLSGTNVDLAFKGTVGTLEPNAPGGHVDRSLADVRVSIPDKGAALILNAEVHGFGGSPLAIVVTPRLDWQPADVTTPEPPPPATEPAIDPEDVDPVPVLDFRAAGTKPGAAPTQITIETKFTTVPRDHAHLIDVGTPLPAKSTGGTVKMLNDAQLRTLVRELETAGVDMMVAPRVTTLSGRQTQVQIVKIDFGGMGPSAAVSSYAQDPLAVGPLLDLIPTANPEAATIELTAIFQFREPIGSTKDNEEASSDSSQGVWRDRRLDARARIYDQQTLMLTTTNVSITGRRVSGGESSTVSEPSNMEGDFIVLISPTMVDRAGNPLHLPLGDQASQVTVPPQPE